MKQAYDRGTRPPVSATHPIGGVMTGVTRLAGVLALSVLLVAGCTTEPAPRPTDSGAVSPTPSASATPEEVLLRLFYVAVGDDGASGEAFGCGDSLIEIESEPVVTDDVLRATIERLLADTEREIGESGLSTALAESSLTYVDGAVQDGIVTVDLSGELAPAGECDNPRIELQLERAAMAATGADEARVFVNGERLEDVLSLR